MQAAKRDNNFNLLRLLFALLVILSHAPEIADGNRSRELLSRVFGTLSFGELAVDGFFLLSGYLIVKSWDRDPHAWRFFSKRALRIFPGFIAASLICLYIVAPLAGGTPGHYVDVAIDLLLLQKPIAVGVFAGTHQAGLNGSLWTISLEFLCYMLILVLGLLGAVKNRKVWLLFTVGLLAATAAQRLGLIPHLDPIWRLAMHFTVGACFYLYRDAVKLDGKYAAVAAVLLILGLCSWRASELAVALFGGYCLFYFALRPIAPLSEFNRLADVSYGVYLYAWPTKKLMFQYAPDASPWLVFLAASVVSIVLGWFSWHLVEKRFIGRETPSKRQLPQPHAAEPI